jgi:hypothetical protein
MPDDNEVESYWDHRQGLRSSPEISQETRDQWNPSGQQVLNILTRVFADPPPEYISQTENARLITTHLTRQHRNTDEYPDYETVRRTFEERTEPGCVLLLDRVVQGHLYSLSLTSGELWEYLRRRYQITPTSQIPEVDKQISDYVLEYCKENHYYPQISIMRGHFISSMRVQERILDLIVRVGGLNEDIPAPSLPQEVVSPQEVSESPSQVILDMRRLALILSSLQEIVDRVGGDEQIDSIITELFTWAEERGAANHMRDNWWEDTLHTFEVTYHIRRGSALQQGSNAYNHVAADRRLLAYNEEYMAMVGHLPSQVEVMTYFANQNDGQALARLAEINNGVQPQLTTGMSVLPIGNTANLELPERRSDGERDYDFRINLRRVALLLDGVIQTCESMPQTLSLRILRDLQTTLDMVGANTFNSYLDPDWRNRTIRDFRVEFLPRDAPGTFPRPVELYPTERRAYQPPMTPMQTRPQERAAEDNRAEDIAFGDQ